MFPHARILPDSRYQSKHLPCYGSTTSPHLWWRSTQPCWFNPTTEWSDWTTVGINRIESGCKGEALPGCGVSPQNFRGWAGGTDPDRQGSTRSMSLMRSA